MQSLPSLAIAVPLLVAVILAAGGRWLPRVVVDAVSTGTAAAVLALDAVILAAVQSGDSVHAVAWMANWLPHKGESVGIPLVIDGIGAGLGLVVAILMVCAFVYSWRYFEEAEALFHVLMLLFLAGMTAFVFTGDLFDMFVYFELMGAAAYALTGYKSEEPRSVHGALAFGIVNSLGAFVTLFGIGLLYAHTGELGLAQLGRALDGNAGHALVVVAFALVCTGFLVKDAAAPFHFWLSDAHAVAPTPVCVLFSGVMVELGLYGVARVYWVSFSGALDASSVRTAWLVIGTATAILGAVMCAAQAHIKRLLAFSTISHIGLFLMGVALLRGDAIAAVAVYVAGHAAVKSALFMGSGVLLNRFDTVEEGLLHGRGKGMWATAFVFVVGGVALAGAPPFGTWLGKTLLDDAAHKGGAAWATYVLIAASGLTGGAVLRVAGRVFFGFGAPAKVRPLAQGSDVEEPETQSGATLRSAPWTMLAPALALIGLAFTVTLVPAVRRGMAHAAGAFTDRHGYLEAALSLRDHAVATPAPVPIWTALGLGTGVAALVLALVVAALALLRPRLPDMVRSLARTAAPVVSGVRALHSGNVSDYVAWLVLGVGVFWGLLLIA